MTRGFQETGDQAHSLVDHLMPTLVELATGSRNASVPGGQPAEQLVGGSTTASQLVDLFEIELACRWAADAGALTGAGAESAAALALAMRATDPVLWSDSASVAAVAFQM